MKKFNSKITHGWLNGASQRYSPHCDARPHNCTIDLIVIHAISLPPEEFGHGYIDDLFLGKLDASAHPYFAEIKGLRVSAHLLIRRDGERVQFVPFHLRAWHAGQSEYQGRERCNDFSIGIELEGSDHQPFTESQYVSLKRCLHELCGHYANLTLDSVTGHSDIAPGRKTDPGPYFDWSQVAASD